MDPGFEPGEREFTAGLREAQRGWRMLLGEPPVGEHDVYRAAAGLGRAAEPQAERGPGVMLVDNGLRVMESALAAMTAAAPSTPQPDAYAHEARVARSIFSALDTLAAKYSAGVPLAHEEVDYEIAMYAAVWATHPYLPVKREE